VGRFLAQDHAYYKAMQLDDLPFRWMSLESITHGKHSAASDVWSVAVLAWEIFHQGRTPYGALSLEQVLASLHAGQRLEFNDTALPLKLRQWVYFFPLASSSALALLLVCMAGWASSPLCAVWV
jgi:serine/threonine protein kinase